MTLGVTLTLPFAGVFFGRAFGNIENFEPGFLAELRLVAPYNLVIPVATTAPAPSTMNWPGSGVFSLGALDAGDEVRFEYETVSGVVIPSNDASWADTVGPNPPPVTTGYSGSPYQTPSDVRGVWWRTGFEVTVPTGTAGASDWNDFYVFIWPASSGWLVGRVGIGSGNGVA